jgi:N-acyl-D-amino-acid deacylase
MQDQCLLQEIFSNKARTRAAYGNFTRVIGKYSRDEKIISLPNAIYKLTKLPATNLHLSEKRRIKSWQLRRHTCF